MPVDPARAKSVFLAASDLADPVERAACLDRECGKDVELRARVEALLRANAAPLSEHEPRDATWTFPANSPPAETASHHAGKDGHAGTIIAGKYTLVEVVGEGGMGSVWRAKQTEPVKRFVAVKLIKAGMDSKQVLARFEAERQALALMDHPNIAKVLDGGLHDHRPYFVMELVKGTPITEYCDKCKLTPKERLELFVQVCQAIQHAHQKGIIHRDIKPSNVLIALYDDKPVVKVIDFGVAKATGAALTEHTIDTGFGGVVGTPQYMSPEQATFNNLDIDTRSDVYALGVLLYELLAGSPPFSGAELKKKGLLEILRVVREEEPPRPSTKLSTADALPSLSANRGTEPKKLAGLLRNELDWIVMKALEKDRSRRYETANGFAADVNRYLSGEAVLAHPPSRGYRVKKFVRRNKGQVIAVSLVFFALLAGMVGTSLGLVEAKRQEAEARRQEGIARDEATAKEQARAAEADQRAKAVAAAEEERKAKEAAVTAAAAEKAAKEQAQENLAFARKGNEILGSVFAGLDPKRNYANVGEFSEALKANLKKAVQDLDGSAIGDPLEVAAMQDTLGRSLLGLGDPGQAIILFAKARATRTAKLGADHPLTLMSLGNLAAGYAAAGKLDLALPLLEETLKLMKAKLGADHPDTLTSMNSLAEGYREANMLDKALPLLEETLKLRTVKLGPDHYMTLNSMNNLALGYLAIGNLEKALPLLEETLKLRTAKLGADHPETLTGMNNMAAGYKTALMLDKAVPLLEETLKLTKARLGAYHPHTLLSMNNLAVGYRAAGKLNKALLLLEETLKLQTEVLGADHPDTLNSMGNLASNYWSANRLDKSVPLFEELLRLQEKKFGRGDPNTLMTVANLGVNYKDSGRLAEAIPFLEEAYRASMKHPMLRGFGPQLLLAYSKADKSVEVARLGLELLADARLTLPKDSPQLAERLAVFGGSLLEVKAFAEAEPLLRECLAIREKKEPDDARTFITQSMLGAALLGQKKYADAEPLLLKGYEGLKQREKTIPPQGATRIPESIDRLIELHTATNKPDEAKKYQELRAKYSSPKEVAPPPREKK